MKLYTNEIVFRGHPDKVCDQISGALLDAFLKSDKNTRAGIEVVGGKGKLFVTGEVTSKAKVDVEAIARRVLKDCGYKADLEIINNLGVQSGDIAMGVDTGGAGDNGMMFGYACADTGELLPTAMVILQKFAREYDELRLKDKRFMSDG
jgi:S-adenosylmethionine synthetase